MRELLLLACVLGLVSLLASFLLGGKGDTLAQPTNQRIEREYWSNGKLLIENNYTDWSNRVGIHRMWSENGTLLVEKEVANRQRNGIYRHFHENGSPWIFTEYKEGKMHGNSTTWDSTGRMRWEYLYRDDKLVQVVSMVDELGRENLLEEGEIEYVWKLVHTINRTSVFIKMKLPPDAKRVPLEGEKLYVSRIDYGLVVDMFDDDDPDLHYNEVVSVREDLRFKVGEYTRSVNFGYDLEPRIKSEILVHRYQDRCWVWKDLYPVWHSFHNFKIVS